MGKDNKALHWSDQTARRVIAEKGDKDQYVVASGITPSGMVHIGNFREVITVDLVARALRDAGKKVRFIYSWDDFDTFRKVPVNLPNQEVLKENLRRPISRIPDPYGKEKSYASSSIKKFEDDVTQMGIRPEYLYQNEKYGAGEYAEGMKHALENKSKLAEILNRHRTSPLAEDWVPSAIFCEKCDKDEMEYQRHDGEWNYSYKCSSCDHEATTDIRKTKNLKLNWRVDWPMRWHFEKVDFEPGGKDHSSEGGSYDTAKMIVKEVWEQGAPVYLQYDFVAIKGGAGKMSSSSGELFTLGEVIEVYSPEMVRWIFAKQRPNTDFSFAFDEDVIKVYDEFDRMVQMVLGPRPEKKAQKYDVARRTFELSTVDGKLPEKAPYQPGFRVLSNRLQICGLDIDRTLERYYSEEIKSDEDRASFKERATRAVTWIEKYAPEDFCYKINSEPQKMELTDLQQKALEAMHTLIETQDFENMEPKEINQALYDEVVHKVEIEPKEFFQIVYQKLISRDRGPRLPGFLKEIGKEHLGKLI